jgi:signal transduction histidine kinase
MIAISLYFLNIFGYLTKYVYPDNPGIGTYVWLVMQSAAVFYIIFVRKFLNLKEVHRKWYLISKYLLIAVVIFVLFKAAYFLVFKGYGILSYLSQIVLFLGVVFTGGLIFSLFKTQNQLAKYFTIGSVSLGLGLLGASMIALSGDAYSKYFFYSIQAGIVFEIFFFSIGLSYKMRESEREKRRVQEELIRQLKENEILQLNYQRELEQKVVERTREIEDQKEVLKFQKDQLQELNEEKNHLISIVAHDLRNPLTSALSMAQLLSSDRENDEKSEIGNVLAGSLKRMNEMVEKILDIRAIESREINLDEEAFDLGKETGLIIDEFAGHAERKSIRVHKELDQAKVFLDRYYFKQVVENLISNALKFSPEGSNIFVSTGQVNGKARISIKDEGPGFTLEDKKRMFGKYQKLSATPTGGESSTGIGLSIVKKYVDAMRGNISCQSESGMGSTFMVEFNNK